MGKNDNKKINEKELLLILLGVSIISFVIITATIQTAIGHFFTFIFGFLFGVFYPVILVFLFALGVFLVFSRKLPHRIDSKKYVLAFSLLFTSLLAFGSYYLILDNHSLRLSDLVYIYNDKMKAFSSSSFKIDSFNGLGGLGGGFIGLFFVLLFGSIWGYIGDAIFFSVLLLVSIVIFSYDPLIRIINNIRDNHDKKKEEEYVSPYNNENKKEYVKPAISHETRELITNTGTYYSQGAFIQDKKILKPLEDNIQISNPNNIQAIEDSKIDENMSNDSFDNNSAFDNFYFDSINNQPSIKPSELNNVIPSAPPVNNTVDDYNFDYNKPQKKENIYEPNPLEEKLDDYSPSDYMDTFKKRSAEDTAQDYEFENPYKNNQEEAQNYVNEPKVSNPNVTPSSNKDLYQNKPYTQEEINTSSVATENYENEDNASYYDDEEDEEISYQENIEDNHNYTSYEEKESDEDLDFNNEYSYEEESPFESESSQYQEDSDDSNVLDREISVDFTEKKEEVVQEKKKPELSEKELIALKDKEYFEKKSQEMYEKRKRKMQEIERKKAELMQFVSPVPKVYSYPLPGLDLLQKINDSAKLQTNQEAAIEKMKIINNVFKEFGLQAHVTGFTLGASVTRFKVETGSGVKADKLEGLTKQIQIALKGDHSVRVQTVVEGSTYSGIEVKNAETMTFPFRSAFNQICKNETERLLLPIGKDLSNQMITYPLNEMPHLLIAGTTGSGKSVLVHSIIVTLIMRNYPNQLKLMLIDPKQVEFTKYEMSPHLFCPIISSAEEAIVALEKLINEMERRYKILANNNCVKISEYRKRRRGFENRMEELPDIVCVIDEFADLMITGGNAVSTYVQRLTAKARAAGIYLIIATQRPSKDAIPMIVKANINCRIGLSCSTQIDSRVILDENGAETLIGKGDLLFKSPTFKSLVRCQSPYISDEDINNVLNYVKQNAGIPSYNADFLEFSNNDLLESSEEEKTPAQLYQDIKEYVMYTGNCIMSSIMTNFQISQKQVRAFISTLEKENIVVYSGAGQYTVKRRM